MNEMGIRERAARAVRRCRWILGLAALLAAVPGCVTSGSYEAMVAERDALESEKGALTARLGELEGKVGGLEDQNRNLASRLDARAAEIASMKGTYDSLVKDLESELASGHVQIEQLREGIRVNVAEEILFPSGSAELNSQGREVLSRVATDLKTASHLIEVLGHTDNVQISSRLKSRYLTNWELGGARASSVVRLFQEQGIDGARLAATSRGPFAPIASNDTEQGRAQNRRIEIRLLPAASKPTASTQ
jgi:chemotaxis protein MotB